jgi:hypothetical protein
VNKIRRPGPSPYVTLVAAIGVGMATVSPGLSAECTGYRQSIASPVRAAQAAIPSAFRLVQDSDDDADSEVPPDQVEKYVAVYTAMQRNRNLTVDAAAAKEGLTVAEFRELEQKIERDDVAREHVRSELQAAASQKP